MKVNNWQTFIKTCVTHVFFSSTTIISISLWTSKRSKENVKWIYWLFKENYFANFRNSYVYFLLFEYFHFKHLIVDNWLCSWMYNYHWFYCGDTFYYDYGWRNLHGWMSSRKHSNIPFNWWSRLDVQKSDELLDHLSSFKWWILYRSCDSAKKKWIFA